jgi:2-polyprenyl-3-methyl-5-hydroxy-6-metoxy-1,4-benzoquinol methylase
MTTSVPLDEERLLDEAKIQAFVTKAQADYSGTLVTALCVLGDRLGLFQDLAANGPATSQELADRTGIQERYAREWLRGLTAAGYLEETPRSGRFVLPPEHAPVLAEESGPMFMGGALQMVPALWAPLDHLTRAFREGGGVAQSEYPPDMWRGMERFTGSWFESVLLDEWITALPDIGERLVEGIVSADVGCGAGRASLTLARAFPRSRFVGFDVFEAQIERARENAERAGLSDRVGFELLDVTKGLPGRYDLVTTFDVIHDAADPAGLLRAIRAATEDDGDYLMLEINCQDRPADNQGPVAAMFYGFSVLYCMTTSLADGGAGLGTCGMPEAKVRELATAAGFSRVERVPVEDPLNVLYDIKP